MTRRTRRIVSIQKVLKQGHFAKFRLYAVNKDLPGSDFEELYYHSAEIKQLWLVGRGLSQDYSVSIHLGEFQSASYLLIPPITVPAGDSLVNVLEKLPFSGLRQSFEMGVRHELQIDVTPAPQGTEQIMINGFAEETGFANELNPT